jgi:hypothetical protein
MENLIHVWEMYEIILHAANSYNNPYLDVEVWIELEGPSFKKKVFGYWNGNDNFCIRFVADKQGEWKWTSFSSISDAGLVGQTGRVEAIEWTKAEKEENSTRRGFLRANENGHAFQYADGTPHYYVADTWWAAATYRFPWVSEEQPKPDWAEMSFQEMVAFRKAQGYNGIGIIAAQPAWADDGFPSTCYVDDEEGTPARHAWQITGSAIDNESIDSRAKDMHNEGGRPFFFPGKVPGLESVVPDYDRINPEYFTYMDRKIAYLNSQGFIPFIEVSRRDAGPTWKKYYEWPGSYARFIKYIFNRYQAYNTLLSPIHYDFKEFTIPSKEYNEPANQVIESQGHPPFGNLLGPNPAPSSLRNFGDPSENKWLTFHQIGNDRPHKTYWYLTEIFHARPALPALNGEPYYPGFPDNNPPAHTKTADRYCRSGMYGSFLSGGLAGYFYGCDGIWGANIEKESENILWDAFKYASGDQVRHLAAFVMQRGPRYQELIPQHQLVYPSRTEDEEGYDGWAYCSHTPEMDWILIYKEQDSTCRFIRSILPDATYNCSLFNPRTGEWKKEYATVTTDQIGEGSLPELPSTEDWALSLELV